MQLRVCAVPIPVILASLWPSVWKGAFRHEKLHDFLLQDVVIESDQPLPYQVGGDARGERTRLTFKVSERPLEMVELGPRLVPAGHAVLQLGPAKVMFKLP
jgi:diacylglycerol kinase family enzyme